MRYRPLGASGIEASVVAFGAWAAGGWLWGGTDRQKAVDAIRAGMDAGMNLIDTAPVYGLGVSEEIVGEALAGCREEAVIATKCGLEWHVKADGHSFDQNGTTVYRHLGPDSIRKEVEESLKRLRTDCIDLYQTHWQDEHTPIADTMAALVDLKGQGKIRAIGVSNATVADMEQYRAIGVIDSDQEPYSMLRRKMEAENLPYCAGNGIAVLAYSPLAQGLLTGKIGPDREFPEGDLRRNGKLFGVENRERVAKMLEKLKPITESRGITFGQLTIAWTVAQPGLSHALVGARNPEQALENAAAGDIVLTDEELSVINGAIDAYERGS